MILTCPNCSTQYVVKDGAIPPEGRQVRCAACKHSWHQEPDHAGPADATAGPPLETTEAQEVQPDAADDESLTEATLIEPRSGPEAEERAYEEAVIEGDAERAAPDAASAAEPAISPTEEDAPLSETTVQPGWNEPPEAEAAPDTFSPFAAPDDEEPRRRSAAATWAMVAIAIIILAALFWFFAPADLKARLGLGAAAASPLALVTTHMDRQRLESGNELLTVTGRVINPTAKEQDVPPLQAQLKSKAGKVVYSWTIAPPARSLPAGASASFNSAEVNVPAGGDELTITLGEPRV
jgi:predicted Zn finger-like uncharacterized protein